MTVIYKHDSGRITVGDAKRLIVQALPHGEPVGYDVAIYYLPNGEHDYSFKPKTERESVASYLDADILENCRQCGFEPHLMYSPARKGYTVKEDGPDESQDKIYMLTHAQFVIVAELYSLTVTVGQPPAPDHDSYVYNEAILRKITEGSNDEVSDTDLVQPDAALVEAASMEVAAPAWTVKTTLKRFPGYRYELFKVVKVFQANGNPRPPTAREVLEYWQENKPFDISVMSDGIKYTASTGDKEVDIRSMTKAIKEMVS